MKIKFSFKFLYGQINLYFMKSFSAVDKKGRRPSEIEMMKKQLKKVPGSDSEDEKVRFQVCM